MSLYVNRGRTLARSQALQLLFQAEVLSKTVDEVVDGDALVSKGPIAPYALELARGCYENLAEIDSLLEKVSRNWSLSRMPGTDRNILRIAVYEMRHVDDLPSVAVAINEAVELAKAYGTDESSRFVNGVLGRIARDKGLSAEGVEQAVESLTQELAEDADAAEPVVLDDTEE